MATTREDLAIRDSPFFKVLDPSDWQQMSAACARDTWRKGRSVSSADLRNSIHFIASGHVKAQRSNPETGRVVTLFLFGPGEMFDVLRLLQAPVEDTTFEAHGEVTLLTVSVDEARRWLEVYPSFNRAVLLYLGKMIAQLERKVADLALHDTETRLASLILDHVERGETNEAHPIHGMSHEDIAQMIGSVRTVVSRQLQYWRQTGIVASERGKIVVRELEALMEKAARHAI